MIQSYVTKEDRDEYNRRTLPEPDEPMNLEEQAIADSLSAEFIRKIDSGLLSHATNNNRKVAMLIGLTMMDNSLRVKGLPDIYYAQRVKALVASGLLTADGNLDYMRFSEVRLPYPS